MDATSLAQALTEARDALGADPATAEARAEALLARVPGNIEALLILGVAHRQQGNLLESLAVLKPLTRTQPDHADAHAEWGATQAAMGLPAPAAASLRRATALNPSHPQAWRDLGDLLLRGGEPAQADAAYLRHARAALTHPVLADAASAVQAGDFATAEQTLRAYLAHHHTDPAAMRMLADIRLHLNDNENASVLYARALALAPSFTPARRGCAVALLQQGLSSARPHVERLLADDPRDPQAQNLHAVLLAMTGDYAAAIDIYQALLRDQPEDARMWLRLGHALRTAGRQADAIAAYRQAAALVPSLGDAYWSLANLKTSVFTPAEIETMLAQAASEDVADDDRYYLQYALGSAFEQLGDYRRSFEHYAAGALARRQTVAYSAAETTARFATLRRQMTSEFFASRQGGGNPDPAPIFVVGLPRSGSTLVEQILASHIQVEGTSELHDIGNIARRLGWGSDADGAAFAEQAAALVASDRAALGTIFIDSTRAHRRRGQTFFIDKMPGNFIHIGLIRLILPNAKIIDARRQPMAVGFAAFKQLFAHGQDFSYDLREIGLFYRDYIALMAHWDEVLPGVVHRVLYEDLVTNTEAEIRRLLAYCGLDFEPACLRFHETARDVLTASSEQVRRPIFRDAVEHWRNYEPWLGDLREALEE